MLNCLLNLSNFHSNNVILHFVIFSSCFGFPLEDLGLSDSIWILGGHEAKFSGIFYEHRIFHLAMVTLWIGQEH